MENKNVKYTEKIVAVIHKDGVYNDKEYHNYNLVTIIYENDTPVKCDCTSYRFKKRDFKEVTGFDNPEFIINTYIKKTYFDKFGRLCGIDYVGADDE